MKLRSLKRRRDAQTTRWALAFAPDADGWRLADEDDLRELLGGPDDDWEDHDDEDDAHCFDCGELHDMCECHIDAECGRWRNGRLSDSCTKAGSEECDFECPYGR